MAAQLARQQRNHWLLSVLDSIAIVDGCVPCCFMSAPFETLLYACGYCRSDCLHLEARRAALAG
jgi:hypothetical protein